MKILAFLGAKVFHLIPELEVERKKSSRAFLTLEIKKTPVLFKHQLHESAWELKVTFSIREFNSMS